MSNARNLADVISGNYDVPAGSLDNVDLTSRVAKSGDTMTGNLIVDANVGIGTSSPNFKTHISTGSTASITQPTAGSYGLYVQQNTSGSAGGIYIQDGASNSGNSLFIADNNGVGRLVVDGDGNVGIGTSSPGYKLDVNGAAAIRAGNLLYSFNSDNTNSTYIYNPGATGAGNGSFLFGIVGQGEQMRLTPAGLGIGTSSPTQKLDVAGTVKATAFVGDGSGLTGLSSGGVTSLNGQTGAITNTSLYAIGSYVMGRTQNFTTYNANDTLAGSSLYNGSTAYWRYDGNWVVIGIVGSPPTVGVGTWRCVSRAGGESPNYGYPGLWVRIS